MFSSPLLFPVQLKGKKIVVLDETLLPFKEEYIEVEDLDKALWVLGSMKTRAFGQVLLFFYSCCLFKNYSIGEIVEKFSKARPTFDFPLLGNILEEKTDRGLSVEEAVERFINSFDELRRKRAQRLAEILSNPARILTVCNVNGEMIYLYEALRELGKEAVFYVSETRPYLQGTRLTFWELRKSNIPAYLICDNQAALLMREGRVNCVVTGADRASKKGGIINKIGTYPAAVLAKHFNIPFYPLTQYPKDIDIRDIEIEERPSIEVFMFLDKNFASVDAVYPSFDVVENNFITECIDLTPSEDEVRGP